MKNKIMLLSLLAPMLLVNCGSKDGEYKVTEEEFNKALNFEGVKYLQVIMDAIDDKTGQHLEAFGYFGYYYSPNAYRKYEVDGKDPQGEEYDQRIFKRMEQAEVRYFDYWRPHLDSDWKKTYNDGSAMQTIAEDVVKECSYIFDLGYSYKDFTYDSNKKAYSITLEEESGNKSNTFCYFKNKKLVTLISNGDADVPGFSMRYAYTYDKEEIEEPHVETWTATIDSASRQYGKFNGQYFSAAIGGDDIGVKEAQITFRPNDGYTGTNFEITAEDEREGAFKVEYEPDSFATITITRTDDKVFESGDVITLHFEESK